MEDKLIITVCARPELYDTPPNYDACKTSRASKRAFLTSVKRPCLYPIQGVTVVPLRSSLIPGVLSSDDSHREVTNCCMTESLYNTVFLSVFHLPLIHPVHVISNTGEGEAELTLTSSSLESLNAVLATISYTSTIYHVHTADLVSFCFKNHEAMFPIVIRQPQLPVMFNMGTGKFNINSQVTITIKTFLRYNNLKVLLSSIRSFYPDMTVIIADDSFEPEKITGENIRQYFMPPAQGWFAGRNLAVSQVTTKYFLWADDDFLFTKDTKIEKLVEVMEAHPELDVVGRNQFYFSLEYDEGEETEGGCLYRKSKGRFNALPGYPQCFMTSGVVNFFLARTDSVQKSRFDPLLQRVAHSEWFMDGLGSLMVASCGGVSIRHQQKTNSNLYNKYRTPSGNSEATFKYQLHFFKNHLKCIKFG
uniref:Glycosyltransferase 2-like domain-containing protein n=1 Tax=Neogobius melanostomus TaxID=47308 RepID=A0A8C6WWX0_9GOBI